MSMEKFLKILFVGIIIFNIILSSWYVLHQDILFSSEIARDFLLLDELDQKKIVLIGPSSTTGLFHGPLWTYLNYPAYFLGNGNPVFVGWGWIVMIIIFVVSGFYFAKELFDTKSAYLFSLMISAYSVFQARGLYNPHGAMLIIPASFFFLIRYQETHKLKYLIIHILLVGMLIQFQMAIGIPFIILSFFYILFINLRSGKKIHILTFGLIFIAISNFIIFDLRHDFILSKVTTRFLTSATRDSPNILSMLEQRINYMTGGVEFVRPDPGNINLTIFIIFAILFFYQIKDNKYRNIYLSFLYFYGGYLVLSNLNSGGLLYFYLFPLFPFVFLIFSSLVTSRFGKVFLIIFLIIFSMNMETAIKEIARAKENIIGKDKNSWLFFKNYSSWLFTTPDNEFGYFVYSPDVIAYRSKYALSYVQKFSSKKTYYFEKKPITYLVIAPPPDDNPYMKDEWWTKNLLHINKKPESVKRFPNGYKIEKYLLSKDGIAVPVEPNIDPGLKFR